MLWLVPIAIAIIDQLIKHFFVTHPMWSASVGGVLSLNLSLFSNGVAAFSLPIPAKEIAFISFFVVLGLIFLLFRSQSKAKSLALVFLIAGALSNLLDRLLMGRVIDYFGVTLLGKVSFFNLADVLIVIGVIAWWRSGRTKKTEPAGAAPKPEPPAPKTN